MLFLLLKQTKEVEGLISNYQQIIDGYLAGADSDRIAEAIQKLGGNFDGPIYDLDL